MVNVPGAPTSVTAVAANQQVTISFSAPSDNGGANITSYTVTLTDSTTPANGGQSATGASSPLTVTGLHNGDSYTATVHATNSAGNSVESTASAAFTPHTTVPDAPTTVTLTAGVEQLSVAFSAPSNNGGASITGYTATLTDTIVPSNGGQTATGATSPLVITGLTPGDAFTATVHATNSLGNSTESVPSALGVPLEPTTGLSTPPPFSDCTAYTVAKPINPPQIQDELATAAGVSVMVALWDSGDTKTISVSNTGTLWVSPSSVSAGTVEAVIAAHVPNWNYGQPQSVQDYLAVIEQIQTDYATTLTADQIQTAIKNLVLNVQSLQNLTLPGSS
jgi:hypothetical protein